MVRVKRGVTKHRRHAKVLAQASGYRGASQRHYKRAKEARSHALRHAYRHRRERKREMRRLWVLRIGAAARAHGLRYSTFIHGLQQGEVPLNRKMLAEMAVRDPQGFEHLVERVRGQLQAE